MTNAEGGAEPPFFQISTLLLREERSVLLSSTSEDSELCCHFLFNMLNFRNRPNQEERSWMRKLASGTLGNVM